MTASQSSPSTRTSTPAPVLLVGPTATGKTALAMALADRLPVSLINMDSAQVFRGMDLGTAKPTAAELSRYPHALLDLCDPAERYSAARFVADADAEVRAALAADRWPLLVGGTMLYARAFCYGLTALPAADAQTRAALEAEAQERGLPALHAELEVADPAAAATIHPANRQRLLRALEVYRLTGRPISEWWRAAPLEDAAQRIPLATGQRPRVLGLWVEDRAQLHRRIEMRFDAMLDGGLIDEVSQLRARGDLDPQLPSVRAVGYRQVWDFLEGRFDHDELRRRGQAATRQLAKRQLTWMRGWDELERIAAEPLWRGQDAVERQADRIVEYLANPQVDGHIP
ncbi:MAG: tRNA (adenosine(37)-N6)-dimethylallyltransferase MiaA [Pseudomonadota bacterium]